MKIRVHASDFASAASWATKSYDSKDSKSYVALEVEDGRVSLRHLNQSSFLSSPMPVESVEYDEDFTVALDGQSLQKIGAAVAKADEEIRLERQDGKKTAPVVVRTSNSMFTIPTINVDVATAPSLTKVAEVNDAQYFTTVSRLSKLCSPTSAAAGAGTDAVSIRFGDDNLTLMATDSYALGEVVLDYDAEDGYADTLGATALLLPQSSANAIAASKDAEGTVELVFDKTNKKFGYRYTDGRVAVFGLDQATPIEYADMKRNILDSVEHELRLSTADFRKAVTTVASLSMDETDVVITVDGAKKVAFVSDSKGRNKIALTADKKAITIDDKVEMSFMTHTIASSLHPILSQTFSFNFSDADTPCVLHPILESGDLDEETFAMAMPNVS